MSYTPTNNSSLINQKEKRRIKMLEVEARRKALEDERLKKLAEKDGKLPQKTFTNSSNLSKSFKTLKNYKSEKNYGIDKLEKHKTEKNDKNEHLEKLNPIPAILTPKPKIQLTNPDDNRFDSKNFSKNIQKIDYNNEKTESKNDIKIHSKYENMDIDKQKFQNNIENNENVENSNNCVKKDARRETFDFKVLFLFYRLQIISLKKSIIII